MTSERTHGERHTDAQRLEVERSADGAAREAQERIRAYQQRLRSGLLATPGPGSARAGRWRELLASLRRVWMAVVRAMP